MCLGVPLRLLRDRRAWGRGGTHSFQGEMDGMGMLEQPTSPSMYVMTSALNMPQQLYRVFKFRTGKSKHESASTTEEHT